MFIGAFYVILNISKGPGTALPCNRRTKLAIEFYAMLGILVVKMNFDFFRLRTASVEF